MFHIRGVFTPFLGGHQIVTSFISVCFSGRVNLKQIEEKTTLGSPGTCSPGKFLKFYMV